MTYVLALVMAVIIVAAQWPLMSRALRSSFHLIGWVTGGYAAKIALPVIGLYVPHTLGMDVKVAAFAMIIAIVVSPTAEMMVMVRKCTMNVDAPSDTQ